MLGSADFFREENQEMWDPNRLIVLIEIDGDSAASNAFGEGGFTWSIDKTPLAEGKLDFASLIFEVGT